jgi:hypothetical protein
VLCLQAFPSQNLNSMGNKNMTILTTYIKNNNLITNRFNLFILVGLINVACINIKKNEKTNLNNSIYYENHMFQSGNSCHFYHSEFVFLNDSIFVYKKFYSENQKSKDLTITDSISGIWNNIANNMIVISEFGMLKIDSKLANILSTMSNRSLFYNDTIYVYNNKEIGFNPVYKRNCNFKKSQKTIQEKFNVTYAPHFWD